MTRIVPFETTYEQIRKLEKAAFLLLLLSALIIMTNWALTKFFSTEFNKQYSDFKEIGKVVSYFSMVSYLIIKLLSKILFHVVEKRKRNDLIDNSFGTNYSDENTEGYYNNEETELGIKKLALNSYESAFHTEYTLKNMLNKNLIVLAIISTPFLLSIFSEGGNDIIRLLFEISIPLTLLSEFVIMVIYYLNVIEINERFKIEFTNIGTATVSEEEIPKLIIPVMEYYSIKAWANTNLDSKTFKKYNRIVSEKWEKRKEKIIK